MGSALSPQPYVSVRAAEAVSDAVWLQELIDFRKRQRSQVKRAMRAAKRVKQM